MATREKGRMLAEVRKEVDVKVDEWKMKVESGEISLQRGVSVTEQDARKRRQAAHVARKRADHQRLRRQRNSVWGRIGRAAVFGDEPASFLAIHQSATATTTEEENDGQVKERQVAAVKPRIEDIVELR